MIYSEICISVHALELMSSLRLKTTNIIKINQYETVVDSVNTHQQKATRSSIANRVDIHFTPRDRRP